MAERNKNKVVTYLGKPLEQMTREELIEAINYLANQLELERSEHARAMDILTR